MGDLGQEIKGKIMNKKETDDAILDNAIAEAERFLAKAKALKQFRKEDKTSRYSYYCLAGHGSINAAMKRASLDLSKALPPLRK